MFRVVKQLEPPNYCKLLYITVYYSVNLVHLME